MRLKSRSLKPPGPHCSKQAFRDSRTSVTKTTKTRTAVPRTGLRLKGSIQLDVTALSVSAAVDANKAQRWTTYLRCMLKEKKCSPDKAAKYAGRLAFTCTIAAGRKGRAFVKPFYSQANAPLRGFDMSPALLNAASWWTKYLELKSSIRLAVHHTMRETVWAWTDASGEDQCLGVEVYARRRWLYTYFVAPPAVLEQLLHRQDSQINFLEMLAVLLFVTTFQDIICGSFITTASYAAC